MIGNKIANSVTKTSQQEKLETIKIENDKEIPKERSRKKDKKILMNRDYNSIIIQR